MPKLEVCCYGADCLLAAEKAGADSIELCSGRLEGGLTPSYGTLQFAHKNVSIPVYPIIRPRGGDFFYNSAECETIEKDIALIRKIGFPGVVFGVLDRDGYIDIDTMRHLMKAAKGMAVTFHRAFDMCINPMMALDQLTELGVSRILTSGQQQTAEVGLSLISQLSNASKGPMIVAGGGIRLTNVHKFLDAGIKVVHGSMSRSIPSKMRYRKAGVSMCTSDSEECEFHSYCVDEDMVGAMKEVLQTYRE